MAAEPSCKKNGALLTLSLPMTNGR
ncbi:conserved hypothetical protein [Prevotella intermedia]|uniref:Uncharacterized protein n=1 Tax=Prevotella intermedia TaxID=28131 RepID=A0A0S3UKP8_PREIN|nr:conserved hypothetical protein [Prevotella intermedia]